MGTAYWTPYHLILEKIPICAFYLVVKDHKKQHGKTYIFLTMLLIISILSRLTLILSDQYSSSSKSALLC